MTVLRAVDRGLAKAQSEFNQRPSVKEGKEPEFHYGIIAPLLGCLNVASVSITPISWSRSHVRDVYSLGSLDLARAAVSARRPGATVVGFDLLVKKGILRRGISRLFRYAKALLEQSMQARRMVQGRFSSGHRPLC